ncbi:TIGR01212 family radical SAM protein [Verrucomicrobiota bacterium]
MIRLAEYYRSRYGHRIFKIPVNAHVPCPHGRCSYCDNASFSPVADETDPSVRVQIEAFFDREPADRRARQYCVYFQPHTTTNCSPAELEGILSQALGFGRVRGFSIGTRPDCVDPGRLDVIRATLAPGGFVEMEYGLQSCHDSTLARINRGHTARDFAKAVEMTAPYGFDVCAHVILFLPGESGRQMLETADFLAGLPLRMVKIHSLYVPKSSPMHAEYVSHPFKLPTLEEYVEVLAAFVGRLRQDMVVSRVCSDVRNSAEAVVPWAEPATTVWALLEQRLGRPGRGDC